MCTVRNTCADIKRLLMQPTMTTSSSHQALLPRSHTSCAAKAAQTTAASLEQPAPIKAASLGAQMIHTHARSTSI